MKGESSREMKITKEADYALRIVAMLAKNGTQMEAKLIAEKNGIPYIWPDFIRNTMKRGIIQ